MTFFDRMNIRFDVMEFLASIHKAKYVEETGQSDSGATFRIYASDSTADDMSFDWDEMRVMSKEFCAMKSRCWVCNGRGWVMLMPSVSRPECGCCGGTGRDREIVK